MTQMCLHGLCCRKYLSPRYQVNTDLRAGQRCLLTVLLPPNEAKKEEMLSALYLFSYLTCWVLPFCPPRCLIVFLQLGAVLGGRFLCWEGQRDGAPKPCSEEGTKRVKNNRGNHFLSHLPELCSLRLKVGQCPVLISAGNYK